MSLTTTVGCIFRLIMMSMWSLTLSPRSRDVTASVHDWLRTAGCHKATWSTTRPTSHNYPLVIGPARSQAILTPRGAYSPAAIFGARNYSNTQAFTLPPGTHLLLGRESARCEQSALPSAAGDRTRDLSLVDYVAHATIEPRRPTTHMYRVHTRTWPAWYQ